MCPLSHLEHWEFRCRGSPHLSSQQKHFAPVHQSSIHHGAESIKHCFLPRLIACLKSQPRMNFSYHARRFLSLRPVRPFIYPVCLRTRPIGCSYFIGYADQPTSATRRRRRAYYDRSNRPLPTIFPVKKRMPTSAFNVPANHYRHVEYKSFRQKYAPTRGGKANLLPARVNIKGPRYSLRKRWLINL